MDDITPATRRMTYAELGKARGISPRSAERLAQRRRWARQIGNDGMARVLVPVSEDRVTPRRQGPSSLPDIAPDVAERRGETSPPDIGDVVRAAIRDVVAPLSAQLEHERQRADRAEQRFDEERTRTADATAAERIARDEAAGLRAEPDARKQWGLWRRVRGR